MSVLQAKEIHEGRLGPIETGKRTYTRVWGVTTSSATDGPIQVREATGIPRLGDAYLTSSEGDAGAVVKKVDPQPTDNPKLWHVRVEYDSSVEEEEENPLNRPAVLSWGSAQFQRVAWKDIDGNAILNSAGQYFDPPPEVDDSRPTLTVTRNEASFNPALKIDYEDAVNTDPFMGFAVGQAKVASINANSQFENGLSFWSVTYEFHFRREGWILAPLDQGRYELWDIAGTKRLVPIKERDTLGRKLTTNVTEPVPLDGAGKQLQNPGPTTAKYKEFTVYKQRTFSVFAF